MAGFENLYSKSEVKLPPPQLISVTTEQLKTVHTTSDLRLTNRP